MTTVGSCCGSIVFPLETCVGRKFCNKVDNLCVCVSVCVCVYECERARPRVCV
jgi:hypothetical protein